MADPVTTLQTAADTIHAANSLATELQIFIPYALYGITASAAFFPKPADDAPVAIKLAYKVVNYIAFNIKHARNIADDRRVNERDAAPDQTTGDAP